MFWRLANFWRGCPKTNPSVKAAASKSQTAQYNCEQESDFRPKPTTETNVCLKSQIILHDARLIQLIPNIPFQPYGQSSPPIQLEHFVVYKTQRCHLCYSPQYFFPVKFKFQISCSLFVVFTAITVTQLLAVTSVISGSLQQCSSKICEKKIIH